MSVQKENDIHIDENVREEAKRNLDSTLRGIIFMKRREAAMNPNGETLDLSRQPESEKGGWLASGWQFSKYLSNGATLGASQVAPNTLFMKASDGVYDNEHAQDMVHNSRLEAVRYGKNLSISDNDPAFDDYCSIAYLNKTGYLPVSRLELDALIARGEELVIADENADLYEANGKGKLVRCGDAKFNIKPFMQDKPLSIEETYGKGIIFELADGVETLDNIKYSLPTPAPENLDIIISGSRDTVNNLRSFPTINADDRSNAPENTDLRFHGTPRNIDPADLADIVHEDILGKNKKLTLLLDDQSEEYRAECDYVNEVYNELMQRDPNIKLVICDRQNDQEVVREFDRYHAPGAEYDTNQLAFERRFKGVDMSEKLEQKMEISKYKREYYTLGE